MKIRISPAAVDLIWILFLTLFAGFIITDLFVAKNGTFWDNAFFYSIFRNQLDSLNVFGEPAWWFPGNQFGWPAYYYSMLGDIPCSTPVFALFGLVSWVSGRLGFGVDYYLLYTVYYGYLIPGLVNLAGYYVLRLFVKTRMALWFGVTIMAFSPGTIDSMSDVGFLEPLFYSLFFFGCWVRYLKEPSPVRFWLLTLSVCMIGLSINYPFVMWNVYFLPCIVLLTIFGVGGGRERLLAAFREPLPWQWALASSAIVISAVPSFLGFQRSGDFIRNSIKSNAYDYTALRPGNPFEIFNTGLPSFGYMWNGPDWNMWQATFEQYITYHYLGILCFPLAVCALIYGPSTVRWCSLIMITIASAMIPLAGYNPIVASVIRMVRPLQNNDHWSDLGFRAGSFLIFIFLSAIGFDLLVKGHRRAGRFFPIIVGVYFIYATATFYWFYGKGMFGANMYGILAVLTMLMLVVAGWLWRAVNDKRRKRALAMLVFLTFIDVSAFSGLHMRLIVQYWGHKIISRPEGSEPNSVGLRRMAMYGTGDMADHILKLEPHFEMMQANFEPWNLWAYRLFGNVRLMDPGTLKENIAREMTRLKENSDGYVLPLDRDYEKHPDFSPFLNPAPRRAGGTLKVDELTYNEIKLSIDSSAPAVLFVRDAFYPGWSASVNGKPADIARALFNSKAIVVPEGQSKVHFKFFPRAVAWSLLLAYVTFCALASYSLLLLYRNKKRNKKRA